MRVYVPQIIYPSKQAVWSLSAAISAFDITIGYGTAPDLYHNELKNLIVLLWIKITPTKSASVAESPRHRTGILVGPGFKPRTMCMGNDYLRACRSRHEGPAACPPGRESAHTWQTENQNWTFVSSVVDSWKYEKLSGDKKMFFSNNASFHVLGLS